MRIELSFVRLQQQHFFDGFSPDASDEELAKIAPEHPAFRIG
jgi:hypothetical protein